MYTCPVCYYTGMQDPPKDYNICECCGTEFGNDDEAHSHEELRTRWIEGGAKWFFRAAPVGWNPWTQLFTANVGSLRYNGIPAMYGGAVLEAARSVNVASVETLPYYTTVTMYGGAVLETGTAIQASNVHGLPYSGAPSIYGGIVLDTATMNYAAQGVLAHAA
jgi:hypothetical protein